MVISNPPEAWKGPNDDPYRRAAGGGPGAANLQLRAARPLWTRPTEGGKMRRLLVAISNGKPLGRHRRAAAHASPQVTGSDPADGADEHQAPDSVTITFDLPLDDSSLIKVVDECGRQIDAENTTVTLNEMSVDIAKKPSGRYKAFYYANPPAGATGSSNGFIDFEVHAGPACGPEAKTEHHHGGGG